MCGRIDFHNTISFTNDMKRYYKGDIEDYIYTDEQKLNEDSKTLYNIFPSSNIVTLITGQPKKLIKARWGLIPHWAKDINFNAPINARAETVDSKASFKMPFRKQRCIIPINGFYEWKQTQNGKTPYYIKPKHDEYFMLAGIWDIFQSKDTLFPQEVLSCAVITITPNSLMEEIHDRMPVILDEASQKIWLDSKIDDIGLLKSLLKPYDADLMQAHEVSSRVNSPSYSGEECIVPLTL